MPKSKRYISRRVLCTELSVAAQSIAAQNYGRARELVLDVLERVEEYDLPGGEMVCRWTWDDEKWSTDCGEAFCFIDGGPSENGMKFCSYCGKKLLGVLRDSQEWNDCYPMGQPVELTEDDGKAPEVNPWNETAAQMTKHGLANDFDAERLQQWCRKQQDMPPEFVEIVNQHFEDLI